MAKLESLERSIRIPDNVEVKLDGRRVHVQGPLGALEDDLSHLPVTLAVRGREVQISVQWPRKREIGMLGTAAAHLRNMVSGVTKGYRYSLRTVYAHFPVTVKVDDKARVVRIENFTGEKTPRYARIEEGAKVSAKGEEIIVEGPDLRTVSQTAANIQNATRIKKKDLRVFLDGIYVFQKSSILSEDGARGS